MVTCVAIPFISASVGFNASGGATGVNTGALLNRPAVRAYNFKAKKKGESGFSLLGPHELIALLRC